MFLEDDSNFACRSGCLEVRSPGSRPHQGGGAPHGAARRPGSSAMACTLRPAFAGNSNWVATSTCYPTKERTN